ncbi:substrate-binding domain-containing protein [Streptomyces sp. NPDC055185]
MYRFWRRTNGTALARDCVPALTSVAQPLQEMGRAALRAVLRQARGEQPDTHRVELMTDSSYGSQRLRPAEALTRCASTCVHEVIAWR